MGESLQNDFFKCKENILDEFMEIDKIKDKIQPKYTHKKVSLRAKVIFRWRREL